MRRTFLLLSVAACERASSSLPPPWALAQPQLEGDELIPGNLASLQLRVLPVGSSVTFFSSSAGMGEGPCEANADGEVCAGILEPTLYGTATANDLGARLDVAVPLDATPDVIYFQAKIVDPEIGATTFSNVIARHIHVPAASARASFDERSDDAGLGGVFTNGNSHTGGVAWLDYNGDYWPDLFVANGSNARHYLFRNDGDGTFTDVSALVPKIDPAQESAAPCFADIDSDGDVDLLVAVDRPAPLATEQPMEPQGGPNLLYVNRGDGTFAQDAYGHGIVDPRGWRNASCALGDFDADGDIDVHLGTWAMNQPDLESYGRLLANDGAGYFKDTGLKLGYGRDVLATLASDLDRDGSIDLYLGNVNSIHDHVGTNPDADDVLYLGGDGLQDATSLSPGLGDDAWAAMGIDIGDTDNDGDFDLYISDRWDIPDPLPRGNAFYINQGEGHFSDNLCDEVGICTGYSTWPVNFADFDRDGWIDLYAGTTESEELDMLYMNRGDGRFESHLVKDFQGNSPRAAAAADYDGDGDVDLFAWNLAEDAQLFVNEGRDAHGWLEIKLTGVSANRDAIGAVVVLSVPGLPDQIRRVSGGDSAHSQSESILHFGLAGASGPAVAQITWPGGATERVEAIPEGRLSFIDQGLGLREESLTEAEALRAASGAVELRVRSNFGGRTQLWISASGDPPRPLRWDPQTGTFTASIDGGHSLAGSLRSLSEVQILGGNHSWTVPVR